MNASSPPTDPSPRPRSRSPASTCSSAATSTTRSWSPRVTRSPAAGCSSSGRCGVDVPSSHDAVALRFREDWGRLVAGLIGWCGDWDLAEECAAEAFAAAVPAWEDSGVPDAPLAWLTTVARNRARDRLRRRTTETAKVALATADTTEVAAFDDDDIPDERLRLMFTCCHPALAMPARVALTLRTLGGLTPAEIGRAYLVAEATME